MDFGSNCSALIRCVIKPAKSVYCLAVGVIVAVMVGSWYRILPTHLCLLLDLEGLRHTVFCVKKKFDSFCGSLVGIAVSVAVAVSVDMVADTRIPMLD